MKCKITDLRKPKKQMCQWCEFSEAAFKFEIAKHTIYLCKNGLVELKEKIETELEK